MRRFCSDRAKKMVQCARLSFYNDQNKIASPHSSPSSPRLDSVESSLSPCSSVPSWWDEVFEASDIRLPAESIQYSSVVKKRLFSSHDIPDRGNDATEVLERSLNVNPLVQKDHCLNLIKTAVLLNGSEKPHGAPETARTHEGLNQVDVPHLSLPVGEKGSVCAEKTGGTSVDVLQTHTGSCLSENSCSSSEKQEKKVYPSHLKILKAKLALNSGAEHVSSKGKLRRARSVKPPCHDKCRRCCSPKLTISERTRIHTEFWSLKDHTKQWQFIKTSVRVFAPRKKFTQKGAKGEKQVSRIYVLNSEGEARKVCKTMFKNTLSICDSWIDSAVGRNIVSCVDLEDKRGKHKNRTLRKTNRTELK